MPRPWKQLRGCSSDRGSSECWLRQQLPAARRRVRAWIGRRRSYSSARAGPRAHGAAAARQLRQAGQQYGGVTWVRGVHSVPLGGADKLAARAGLRWLGLLLLPLLRRLRAAAAAWRNVQSCCSSVADRAVGEKGHAGIQHVIPPHTAEGWWRKLRRLWVWAGGWWDPGHAGRRYGAGWAGTRRDS